MTEPAFGSLNEHWHPTEDEEYVVEAVQRVRTALNMTHTRDLTLDTIPAAPEAAQRFACPAAREAADAATDRAATLDRFWAVRPQPRRYRSLAADARHLRAWQLRQEGWSYQRIADELGYRTWTGAQYAVLVTARRQEVAA